MKKFKKNYQKGNVIIMLLFFMIVATTITASAVAIVITNSLGSTKLQESTIAASIAESGGENALIRLLRDPNYTGETLPVGSGTATITVTGTNTKTITSVGVNGNFTRTIVITTQYNNNILSVSSWQEQ